MDDGARYRNWVAGNPAGAVRPEPARLLAPLMLVALTMATPLLVPVPVAAVLILAALAWVGARVQECGAVDSGVSLRTGSGAERHSRDPRACNGGWR